MQGHGLLSEATISRYELDSSRSLSAEPKGAKKAVAAVLESPGYWVLVVMFILLDLGMFAWQVRGSGGRREGGNGLPRQPPPPRRLQVIYDDDPDLHVYELLIAR